MPNLLAMSFEAPLTPAFDLHCLDPDRNPPDGWGIACYPGGEPAALVLKEAAPSQGSLRRSSVQGASGCWAAGAAATGQGSAPSVVKRCARREADSKRVSGWAS